MVSAWEAISNRRSQDRYRISLQASVSLVENNTSDRQWPSVLARTTEISLDGIALIVPSTHMGRHDLREGRHLLRIILAVSTSSNVAIMARLIHFGPFDTGQAEPSYLIGVKIEQLGAVDCLLYAEFIRSLAKKKG
ncbi:MAG TPA: PilZ domain-containing protein [Pyrinomonadaceae bacterium]|nr:PilZ domain-containing protein [Pyrinomonadaceae bacterium]